MEKLGRDGLPLQHLKHLKQCSKHHVYYMWKHDLAYYDRANVVIYAPTRVCPVCVKLNRLECQAMLNSFWNREAHKASKFNLRKRSGK